LVEIRARYDRLVETSPFATVLFRDGRVVFANPAAVVMFGAKTPAGLLGRTVMSFIPRKFLPLAGNYRKTLRNGEPMPLLGLRLKRIDGSEFDAEVEGAPIAATDTSANEHEIQLVVRDVTEHLAMESRLRDSEARLRLIMTQTPAYVMLVDRELRCAYINKIAKGTNRSEIIGHNVVNFAVGEYRQQVRRALKLALKTGEPQQILIKGFGRSTGVCWYDVKIGIINNHRRVAELIVIANDVTDRVVAEARNRDLDGFKRRHRKSKK
jgi:PAS domain S-box-containing protein